MALLFPDWDCPEKVEGASQRPPSQGLACWGWEDGRSWILPHPHPHRKYTLGGWALERWEGGGSVGKSTRPGGSQEADFRPGSLCKPAVKRLSTEQGPSSNGCSVPYLLYKQMDEPMAAWHDPALKGFPTWRTDPRMAAEQGVRCPI